MFLKWSLFALVLAYVVRQGWTLWHADEIQQASLGQIQAGWLVWSGVAYAAGWLPSVWFWHRMMRALGGRVRFRDSARAYYCGHLGKYVPGKAMVLVIRSAMMAQRGSSAWAAALTAAYETLTLMGTGVAVGAALAPLLFDDSQTAGWPAWIVWMIGQPLLPPLAVLAACALALPVVSRILSRIAARWTPPQMQETGQAPGIPTRLIAEGMLTFVVSWLLQGLSLGLTLRGVGGEAAAPFSLSDWPVWTGAVALSTSIGFAVLFAPGGLGVREGLLMAILSHQPGIGARQALLATVFSRLISLVTEFVAAGGLYYLIRPAGTAPPDSHRSREDLRP